MNNMRKLRRKDNEDEDRFLKGNGVNESPTNMKMKNTTILQNSNASFDNYAAMMKRRKASHKHLEGLPEGSSFQDGEEKEEDALKINKKNPQARDGHIACLYESKMLIFGGDRHHMPFNDLFLLDIDDFFFNKNDS